MIENLTGSTNLAIGVQSLNANTSGNLNIAIGFDALKANTIGLQNTAIGWRSLNANISGNNNTGIGIDTLFFNTIGVENIAIGAAALHDNVTGNYNTATGYFSSYENLGNNNTSHGHFSLQLKNIGDNNTAIGYQSLYVLLTGENNIGLGASSGSLYISSESKNIVIGNNGVTGDNNIIRIGDSTPVTGHLKNFQAGIFGVTTDVADGIAVLVSSSGQLGTVSSSRILKDNISEMTDVKDIVARLKPSRFSFKSDLTHTLTYGLIADECKEVIPDIVIPLNDELETIQYHLLPIILLKEIQRLQQITDQQAILIDKIINHS